MGLAPFFIANRIYRAEFSFALPISRGRIKLLRKFESLDGGYNLGVGYRRLACIRCPLRTAGFRSSPS